ncbi:Tyrosine recombinase XerC [subsurface metagenome]
MGKKYRLFRRKGKKIWYMNYYVDGERIPRSTGETVKYRAEDAAEQFLAKLDTTKVPTLKEYAADFFTWERSDWIRRQHAKGRPFSKAVAQFRQIHLDKHILPEFGDHRLDEINQVAVERWLISLELSNQTKNHILYSFRIILKDAELSGRIPANPLEKVEPMGKDARRRDVFSIEELRLLFPKKQSELMEVWEHPQKAALFAILATSGLRSGEIRALQWQYVLEEYTALLVRESVKEHERRIGTTKSGDQRVVLLPARTAGLLKKWRGLTPYSDPGALVFYGRDYQTPLHGRTLNYWLADALVNAEIKPGSRKLVVHSFRHTYNSLMKNILPAETLRQLVGHKSESMTRNYDHPGVSDLLQRVQGAKPLLEGFFKNTI